MGSRDSHVLLERKTKLLYNPRLYYMFKVNNINYRTRFKICSKLTKKTTEWYYWRRLDPYLLTLKIFCALSYRFDCWLWAYNVGRNCNFFWLLSSNKTDPKWTQNGLCFHFGVKFYFGVRYFIISVPLTSGEVKLTSVQMSLRSI